MRIILQQIIIRSNWDAGISNGLVLDQNIGTVEQAFEICSATASMTLARKLRRSLSQDGALNISSEPVCTAHQAISRVFHRGNNSFSACSEIVQRYLEVNFAERRLSEEEKILLEYRTIEWAIFNYLYTTNCWDIIREVYELELARLSERDIPQNPFVSRETWIEFYNQHLLQFSPDSMMYVHPWLMHILDLDWIPEGHRFGFAFPFSTFDREWDNTLSLFLAGGQDQQSPLFFFNGGLPPEVLMFILSLYVQLPNVHHK